MINPHLINPTEFRGPETPNADGAVVLLHGRRQTIEEIYRCAERISIPSLLYAMPVADQITWYPRAFMRPVEDNEPRLGHALAAVDETVRALIGRGFSRDRIALMGFSQGACLACEYVYRNPDRWGGLIAFSGGLFGPEGTTWKTTARFPRTPVFLGIGDPDDWIPTARVEETARAFQAAGAEARERIYPGIGHRVCDEEIAEAREILTTLSAFETDMAPVRTAMTNSGASR